MRILLVVTTVLLGTTVVQAQQPVTRVRVILALATASHTRLAPPCACPGNGDCECSYCQGAGTCACREACSCASAPRVQVKTIQQPRMLRMVPAANYYRGLPMTTSNCVGGR